MPEPTSNEREQTSSVGERTTDKPKNGPRRTRLRPLVLTGLFIAAVVLFYLVGLDVLVPAD
jgi:hypothetical protein